MKIPSPFPDLPPPFLLKPPGLPSREVVEIEKRHTLFLQTPKLSYMATGTLLDKVNKLMSTEEITTLEQAYKYLLVITRQKYVIAIASDRKWGSEKSEVEHGTFYQVMPGDGDIGFFDWYCDVRPYHQFFTTVQGAVTHFVFYWSLWKQDQK